MTSFRDTRHLWALATILAAAAGGLVVLRTALRPATYGDTGPYRAASLAENAALPSVFQADAICHECHADVEKERAGTLHEAVRCVHCHGRALEHVALARRAHDDSAVTVVPAAVWDGDFLTKQDLFISRDLATCMACHEAVVGMPADFKKIVLAAHLEEQGATDPTARDSCLECHGPHDTAP